MFKTIITPANLPEGVIVYLDDEVNRLSELYDPKAFKGKIFTGSAVTEGILRTFFDIAKAYGKFIGLNSDSINRYVNATSVDPRFIYSVDRGSLDQAVEFKYLRSVQVRENPPLYFQTEKAIRSAGIGKLLEVNVILSDTLGPDWESVVDSVIGKSPK